MARTVVKQVRLRGRVSAKVVGGLDVNLSLELSGKEYSVLPYLPDEDRVWSDLLPLTYGKKTGIYKDFTDDDFIKDFLDRLNSGKIGFGSYLNYTSVPADISSPGSPGKSSKNVYAIIQDPFNKAVIPEEDTDLKDRRKLWEDYTEVKKAEDSKKPTPPNSDPVLTKTAPPALSGKIILKKKSGPGEITGVTEFPMEKIPDVDSAKVDFKEIQFTEPGDYIITVSSDNEQIESKEISIKVLQKPDLIPQEEKNKETPKEKNVGGSRPIITQIDQPLINVPPIKFDQDKSAGTAGQKPVTDGLGFTPFIWYSGYQIKTQDLISMNLYHTGIIPKFEFTFKDTFNIMKGEGTPQDQTSIELFLNSTSENIKSIHLVFKIEGFEKSPEKSGQSYTIRGAIDLPKLYLTKNKSYKGTSFEVLREISKELELGFNSNITNADDSMTWRCSNKKPFEFIDDVIQHSYISDKSFMLGYIDYYYCFNYVDIEKEKSRNVSSDIAIDTSASSQTSTPQDQDRIIPLRLTNDQSSNSSSLFFEKYTTKNNSTKKSLEIGYTTRAKYYDRVTKSFLVFDIDSSTSDGKSSLILKGKQQDDKFFKENIITKFLGKLDMDNMHKNYNYAYTQNRINLDNLTKIVVDVTMSNANFCLYKYMNVTIDVMNQGASPTEEMMDYRYSGKYIISSISFIYRRGKLKQELTLVRSELGKTKKEMEDPAPVSKKPEEKQINENPAVPGTSASTPPISPNSVYVIGEVLTVQDDAGVKYKLTVKQLLENGTEVLGNLEQI